MGANQPMTAGQAATLKRLAKAAYELDAFNSPHWRPKVYHGEGA